MRHVALLMLALLGACGPSSSTAASDASAAPVATGVVTTEGGVTALPDPTLRYPKGARVVRVDTDGTRTVLSEGLAAAGAPFVHHDGSRVLFVGRETPDTPFRVYECGVDGSARRVVVEHAGDCVRAAYLPDERIVYAGTLPGIGPMAGVSGRTALFVADAEGGAGERITFGAGLDTDPTVLSDGRVLFSSWRPDAAGGGRLGLFTVHPDGTGYAPFHLQGDRLVYPVQQPDLDVRFTLLDAAPEPLERYTFWDAPSMIGEIDEPLGESVPLAARPRPQGHLSSVKPDRPYGTLVCVDARSTGATSATHVQLATYGGERRVLGRTPLASDGSFMVQVPPDTPILVQLLDADGKLVREEHGPMWVRRNEARVCVTCHEDVQTAPPNQRPLAVLEEPVDMTGMDR